MASTQKSNRLPFSAVASLSLPFALIHLLHALSAIFNHFLHVYFLPILARPFPISPSAVKSRTKNLSKIPTHIALLVPSENDKVGLEYAIDRIVVHYYRYVDGWLPLVVRSPLERLQVISPKCQGNVSDEEWQKWNVIAEFICYCSCLDGIQFCSIYQRDDWPCHALESFIALLSKKFSSFHAESPTQCQSHPFLNIRFAYSEKPIAMISSLSPINSLSAPTKQGLTVTLLTYNNSSKPHLLEIIKSWDNPPSRINEDTLTARLQDHTHTTLPIPDPDLLILPTPFIQLHGFPSYQIRLTEIFCIQGNTKWGWYLWIQSLRKWAKCDQRFGR